MEDFLVFSSFLCGDVSRIQLLQLFSLPMAYCYDDQNLFSSPGENNIVFCVYVFCLACVHVWAICIYAPPRGCKAGI